MSFRHHAQIRPAPAPRQALSPAVAAVAAALLFAGCERESRVDRATAEKILLLANGGEPRALDPHVVAAVGDANILRATFEGLVSNHESDDSIDEPGVAERWESNDDFTEWRFFLRPEARWSNGDPVTAHDFVYAYHRILHPEMAAPYASMLYRLRNARAFNQGEIDDFSEVGVKAVGDRELLCVLENPVPFFPDVVKHTTWLPVHQGNIETYGGMTEPFTAWQKPGNQISNGPFVLTDWRINAHVKVRRNPHYWDVESVRINGIDFYAIDSTYTEEKAFRNGLIHYTYTLPQNLIPRYLESGDPRLRVEPYAGTYFFRFNTEKPPFDNVDFRRALAYAVNQETIVEFVTRGGQIPAYAFTPPSEGGYAPPRRFAHDPDRARDYLSRAGYASGDEVPEFTILINTSEQHKAIAVAIQDMWRRTLGLERVRLENQEWRVFQQTVNTLDYEVSRAGWIGDFIDPTTFLDMWVTGDSNNRTGWSNEEYDRLIEDSSRAPSMEERYAMLAEAEEILLDELPVIPLYWYNRVYLLHPDVQNWNPMLLDNRPFKRIDLVREGGNREP